MSNQLDIRLVAGCMTGTSLDGLDAALVVISGHGLEMKTKYVGMVSAPLDSLRDELRHFASGGAAEPIRFMRASRRLGELHAEVVEQLCKQEGCGQLDFVVAHGQTIWHAPDNREASGNAGMSWQLFDPWPIVRRLKVPTCYDLRQADLVAGGQGAPITPLSDWVMYRGPRDLVVNLGGICNVTYWTDLKEPRRSIRGADIGPCNLLLDGLVSRLFPPHQFDADGRFSTGAKPDESMIGTIGRMVSERIDRVRSHGREQFDDAWFDELIRVTGAKLRPREVLAAAVVEIVNRIAAVSRTMRPDRVILAGGGARNPTLVNEMKARISETDKVVLSDEVGIPIDAREAMGFAVLGALSQDGVPITLPQVTGATAPGRAGAWAYP
ncbi:MAG: anhydro-N-acetylmuramic acid kinase [Phycisphaeraceae bacterium]|nr:anhydro-N-acetylmuramic acid kinase [Phycisphaeraceae bacterium]